jgi:DNA repair protein RadC
MPKTTDREIREKLIVSGAGALSDAELLAVVLREGSDTLSAVELAEKILAEFGGGVSELASAGIARIRRAAGCGTVKAVGIAAVGELARRITAEKALSVNTVVSKEDVVKLFAPLSELPHEEFWALYLTSGGRVIDRVRLSQGGVAGTVVDHKLVVKRAVELLAPSLILVHNHPSGIAQPSRDDISVTETIATAAALFDIAVIDHIIISASGSFSFAENGRIPDYIGKSTV